MGKIFIAILVTIVSYGTVAAQHYYYLQNFNNYLNINPAYAGVSGKNDIYVVSAQHFYPRYRYSYPFLEQYSGKTTYILYTVMASYNGAIKENHGIGGSALLDAFTSKDLPRGIDYRYKRSKFNLSYSYRIKIKTHSLRLGAGVNYTNFRMFDNGYKGYAGSHWNPSAPMPPGPKLEHFIDLDLGVWYTWAGIYAGISATQLFNHNLSKDETFYLENSPAGINFIVGGRYEFVKPVNVHGHALLYNDHLGVSSPYVNVLDYNIGFNTEIRFNRSIKKVLITGVGYSSATHGPYFFLGGKIGSMVKVGLTYSVSVGDAPVGNYLEESAGVQF